MTSREINHAPGTPAWPLILVLGLAAMMSGMLVVAVHQFTSPIIAENQRRAVARAIGRVVPGAVGNRAFIVENGKLIPAGEKARGEVIYAAYGKDGKLLGIAARAGAQGYADMIHMLFGYDPESGRILGFEVLKMTETPGLGDKIASDGKFRANFPLDARLDGTGKKLAHPIVTVKHGKKSKPWEIDAISGATISSRAVGKALNEAAGRLLPVIHANLDMLRAAAPGRGATGEEK